MADDRGHIGQGVPDGVPGRAGEQRHDPWAPPEEKASLHKTGPSPADGSAQNGAPGGGAPAVPPQRHAPHGGGPGAYNPYGPPTEPAPYPSAPYGYPPQPAYPYAGYPQPAMPGMPGMPWGGGPPLPGGTSTAAMVLGIIGLVLISTCYGSFLAVFISPVALGLGISARRKVAAGLQGASGQANAGFVMGIIGTVLSLVIAAVMVLVLIGAVHERRNSHDDGFDDSYQAHAAVSALVSAG